MREFPVVHIVQTGSEARPASQTSYPTGTLYKARPKLRTNHSAHIVPRYEAVDLYLHSNSWRGPQRSNPRDNCILTFAIAIQMSRVSSVSTDTSCEILSRQILVRFLSEAKYALLPLADPDGLWDRVRCFFCKSKVIPTNHHLVWCYECVRHLHFPIIFIDW